MNKPEEPFSPFDNVFAFEEAICPKCNSICEVRIALRDMEIAWTPYKKGDKNYFCSNCRHRFDEKQR